MLKDAMDTWYNDSNTDISNSNFEADGRRAACREFPRVGSSRSSEHQVTDKREPLHEHRILVREPHAACHRVFRCLH